MAFFTDPAMIKIMIPLLATFIIIPIIRKTYSLIEVSSEFENFIRMTNASRFNKPFFLTLAVGLVVFIISIFIYLSFKLEFVIFYCSFVIIVTVAIFLPNFNKNDFLKDERILACLLIIIFFGVNPFLLFMTEDFSDILRLISRISIGSIIYSILLILLFNLFRSILRRKQRKKNYKLIFILKNNVIIEGTVISITKQGDYIININRIENEEPSILYNKSTAEVYLNKSEIQRIIFHKP
ncbi:hypothetical protein OB236_23850 [Paenibacillus sp. WQ 127069]|uniref:NfeD-like C-terminal domain-containing protein n=1 Tax=Paenibacillus baimaensis TaxID=2982185 RepID=A0ABT2UKH5_9BACL|nr:hypothetical protein [Paenibacillus sp. WQ 127069]MCU6795145.1 hypothetical protein [Paenibacillus sp. WQ 127069]